MYYILVTGGKGMVGHAVKEILCRPLFHLLITDKDTLDVSNQSDFEQYEREQFDYIVHLAAETDLEKCETKPKDAYYTNAIGTANVVDFAQKKEIPVVYISTAGVFDGTKIGAYTEKDIPNPINHYGRSKYFGELFVRDYPKHYILRASWMIGGGKRVDKKFVNKIYKKLKSGQKEIKVCDDVFGSPTYTKDLANTIKYVITNKYPFGLYNTGGKGFASRYEVACEIVKELGYEVNVIPVKDDELRKEFFCPRAKNEVLETSSMPYMRDWHITLKEYLNDYFRH